MQLTFEISASICRFGLSFNGLLHILFELFLREENTCKFLLAEAENLSLQGIQFHEDNFGISRNNLEDKLIYLESFLTQTPESSLAALLSKVPLGC